MLPWPEKVLLHVSPSRLPRQFADPLLDFSPTRWCMRAAVAMSMLARLDFDELPSMEPFCGRVSDPSSIPRGCPARSQSCSNACGCPVGVTSGALAVLCRSESQSQCSCRGGDRHTVLRLAFAVRGTMGLGELERQGEGLGMRVAINSAGMCFSKSGERPRGDKVIGCAPSCPRCCFTLGCLLLTPESQPPPMVRTRR